MTDIKKQSLRQWFAALWSTESFIVLSFILAACTSRIVSSYVFPVYDDAYITYRYAHNLVAHGQYVYNLNDWVLGTTAPLFGFISSIPAFLSLPLDSSAIALNIIVDLCISFMLLYVAQSEGANVRVTLSLLSFSLFLNPSLARISSGGMEVNLFALACICSVVLFHSRRLLSAIVLTSVAYFLRPESVLLLLVFGLTLILQKRWRDLLRSCLLSIGVVILPLVFMQFRYGSFLSHSVLAKSHNLHKPLSRILYSFISPEPFTMAVVSIGIVGALVLLRKGNLNGMSKQLILLAALTLSSFLAARPQMWSWYAELFIIVMSFAASSYCAYLITEQFSSLRLSKWLQQPVVLFSIMLMPLLGMTTLALVRGKSKVEQNVYQPIRSYCSANLSDKDSVFALDIGILGYSCESTIIDGNALVSDGVDPDESTESKLRRFHPQYLLLNNMRGDATTMMSEEMRRLYIPVVRFSPDLPSPIYSPSHMEPDWTNDWVQAYTLYKRR